MIIVNKKSCLTPTTANSRYSGHTCAHGAAGPKVYSIWAKAKAISVRNGRLRLPSGLSLLARRLRMKNNTIFSSNRCSAHLWPYTSSRLDVADGFRCHCTLPFIIPQDFLEHIIFRFSASHARRKSQVLTHWKRQSKSKTERVAKKCGKYWKKRKIFFSVSDSRVM